MPTDDSAFLVRTLPALVLFTLVLAVLAGAFG